MPLPPGPYVLIGSRNERAWVGDRVSIASNTTGPARLNGRWFISDILYTPDPEVSLRWSPGSKGTSRRSSLRPRLSDLLGYTVRNITKIGPYETEFLTWMAEQTLVVPESQGDLLMTVPSRSTPGVRYEVRRSPKGGFWCTCPGWKNSKRVPKSCRHTLSLEACLSEQPISPGTLIGVVPAAVYPAAVDIETPVIRAVRAVRADSDRIILLGDE